MQFYWAAAVMFIKMMVTNNFVYWSAGLEGPAFDHHRRNGGRGICQQKLLVGLGIWMIFQMPGGLPGEGMFSS